MNKSSCRVLAYGGLLALPALLLAQNPASQEEVPADSVSVDAEVTMDPASDPQPTPGDDTTTALSTSTPAPSSGSITLGTTAPAAPAAVIAETQPKDTLSVDFPDEDIRNILRNVADLFELNIVIPDTLQGRTSLKLRDVTWRQIFQFTLQPVGFTFVEDGNIINVVSQASLAQEPVTTEVFVINYATAADILSSLAPLIDAGAGGKSVVDSRSNALIITERPSQLSKMRPIIDKLDKATAQVMIESKFIEVSNRDLKNVGVLWSSLAGYGVGVGNLSHSYAGETNKAVRSGSNATSGSNFNQSNTDTVTLPANTFAGTNTTQSGNSSTLNQLMDITRNRTNDRASTAVFSADSFDLVLSALQTMNDTRLISNPTIVTLNNTEATILVGDKYPIATPEFNPESGQITYEITPQDIGVILKVTPQVNAQGFIKLTVEPEVSSLNGTVTIPGGAEYPIVATRTAKTQVSLRDGYTMGIGGLVEQTTGKVETKVPVLGNIPGLGRLFRSDGKNDSGRNMLIFITARSISPDGAPVEQIFDSRVVRQMAMQESDLPGYRDGSTPFIVPPPPEEPKAKSKR